MARRSVPLPLAPLGFFLFFMVVYAARSLWSDRSISAWTLIGGVVAVGLVVLVVVVWRRRARKRVERTRLAETQSIIRKQLDAIASDILKLEGEVRVPGNDEALARYRSATVTYTAALTKLEAADTAPELADLATQLDVAIWQLDTTEALLDGKPLPEKPHAEPALQPTTAEPGYQRRAGRASRVGVLDMIAAMLETRPMSRGARSRLVHRRSLRRWAEMGPMRMGPEDRFDGMGWPAGEGGETAIEVLRRRYAAGEISDEEYDAKRSRLERGERRGDF